MPWLTGLGKRNYEWAMGHRKERPTMGPLPAPSLHQRRVMDGADSDHCSDSGGTSTADVEMQDSGLEMSVNEGEAEGML